MPVIAICGAKSHALAMNDLAKALEALGVTALTPSDFDADAYEGKLDERGMRLLLQGMQLKRMQDIRHADAVMIFNPGGFMTNTMTLELGFAYASGQTVIALCRSGESLNEALFTHTLAAGDGKLDANAVATEILSLAGGRRLW